MTILFSIAIPAMLLLGAFSDSVVAVLALAGIVLYIAYLMSGVEIIRPSDSYRNHIYEA